MSEIKSPFMIDWAITSRCNLKCRHCRGMYKGDISDERAEELVNEIAELKPGWVIVEGGEPLLRNNLFELLALMRQKDLDVHMITNGMLINQDILNRLSQLGVKLIISVDGATPETYQEIRAGADFVKALQAARLCADAGLLEAIDFTVLKKNYREIPDIFKLAASIGVSKVTLIGLKPCHNYSAELLTAEECGEAIRLTCRAAHETGIEFFFDEPFFWAVVKEWGLEAQLPTKEAGILVSSTTACIFGEYLFIEPSGDVKPCSFSPMTVGNVKEKSLGEVWSNVLSSPFFCKIGDFQSRSGSCQNCKYLRYCKGCRSRTFVLTGDWFASDPCCPLSLKIPSKI